MRDLFRPKFHPFSDLAHKYRRLVSFLLSLLVGIAAYFIFVAPAFAIIAPEPPIPTAAVEWGQQAARIPDWSQITLRSLPPVLSDGSFDAPAEILNILGYDPSRTWQAGQTADTYLKLGDFQTSGLAQ